MERKTKVHAEDGKQELYITREFDLPVELLFRAHAEPDLIQQWMGTRVLKFEPKRHGGWQYQTADAEGNVLFAANGTFHEFETDRRITRTFEMQNGFGVQLEFLEFEKLTDQTSRLTIHSIYRTPALRDQQLKLPFAYGINMAHERLERVFSA